MTTGDYTPSADTLAQGIHPAAPQVTFVPSIPCSPGSSCGSVSISSISHFFEQRVNFTFELGGPLNGTLATAVSPNVTISTACGPGSTIPVGPNLDQQFYNYS